MPVKYDPYADENDPERDALIGALDPTVTTDPFASKARTETDGYGSGGDPIGGSEPDMPVTGPEVDAEHAAILSGLAGNQTAPLATSGQSAAGGPIYTQTPGSAAYRGPATTAASALPINQVGPSPLAGNINDYLNRILTSDPYNVTLDDPGVKASSEAYRRSRERTLTGNREAIAERMNAEGTMGGGMDAWVQDAYQNMGQDVAANDAQLVLGRQQQRVSQLNSALTTGAGLLTTDQEQAIRMEIARLQNELGQGQLSYQNMAAQLGDDQFYANLNDYLLPYLKARIDAGAL